MKRRVKYIIDIGLVNQISQEDREKLKEVTDKFAFRTNDYYNSLINWNDPEDPIRKIVIPIRLEK